MPISRSDLLLKTLQLSANRLAYELRTAVRAGDCVDFFQRVDRKPNNDWLNLHRGTAHENNIPESDIAY